MTALAKTYPILHVTGPVACLYDGGHTVGEARVTTDGIVVGLFEQHFGDDFGYHETLKERHIPVIGATIAEAASELLIYAYTREVVDEGSERGLSAFECTGLRLTGERHEAIERWLTGLEVPVVAEYSA